MSQPLLHSHIYTVISCSNHYLIILTYRSHRTIHKVPIIFLKIRTFQFFLTQPWVANGLILLTNSTDQQARPPSYLPCPAHYKNSHHYQKFSRSSEAPYLQCSWTKNLYCPSAWSHFSDPSTLLQDYRSYYISTYIVVVVTLIQASWYPKEVKVHLHQRLFQFFSLSWN
jgi:hypothetical protein